MSGGKGEANSHGEPSAGKPKAMNLAWGLHRLGHFAANSPWRALAIVIALCALAGFGISRIEVNTSLDALFQSNRPEYRHYQELRALFPLNERDVLLIATAPKPFTPDEIETLRDLHLELQLLPQAEGVLSLFSIRDQPDETGYAPPIVPDDLPDGDAFTALMASVASNPFVSGKLLRTTPTGGQAIVMIVGLKTEATDKPNLRETIDSVTQATRSMLADSGLKYELLGAPVMQLDVQMASYFDRLTFNLAGFLIGLLACFVFFGRIKLVAIITLCPAIAVVWSFGIIGLFGFPMSFLMNSIAPLVMVISFADAAHLNFGIRTRLHDGDSVREAVAKTVDNVAPACLLTTLTTAIAFSSLAVSSSQSIRDFAFVGGMAVMSIFAVSMLVVPSLAVLILSGNEGRGNLKLAGLATDSGLARACDALARWNPRHAWGIAITATSLCLVCTAMYLSLDPRFRLSEQVPNALRQRIADTEKVAGFIASSPIYVAIRYPAGEQATSERLRRVLAQVEDALSDGNRVGNVWSLALLERQFADAPEDKLTRYLADLPENLRSRLMNEPDRVLLVTGHFPDLDATEMRDAIGKIEAKLDPIRAANSDLSIEVTGISAVSALHASTMIRDLNRSLMSAILVVMVVIGVAFRSLKVPFIAFLPNILPVVASGALLYLFDFGLDYAEIIGLTVAFELAVDDTIHFIARYQLERNEGLDMQAAVAGATRHVGPVLVITTVVLIFGVGVTLLGQMPQTRTFGSVVMVTLVSALAADLFFVPALILISGPRRRQAP